MWCGTERAEITAGKVRSVVAMLALRARHPVAASTVLDALWGDDPPASAANAVQVYVSTIRRALRAAGAGDVRHLLASSAAGYELAVDPDGVDAIRFEQLVSAGTAALDRGDAAVASEALAAAMGCWSGERALADIDEEFADPIRARFDELRLMAVERRVDARLALGAASELIPELEALVSAHPYRESLWERLMVALYRSGRQRDALHALQRVRSALLEELGIVPGPALVALESAILRQDEYLAPPLPQSAFAAAEASERPAPALRQPIIVGLASPPASLLGRSRDLAELREVVRSDDMRIVTLTGPGGVGKTRLSIALATEALADFDPVVFVDLAAATQGSDVATALAAVLGLAPGSDAISTVADHLGDSPALVVLDNLEQVRDASAAVASLVVRLPALTVVATSRSPLRLAVEHEHRVGPLAMDDARALFVARAKAAHIDRLDDAATASLNRICQRLDCLPLALELAAARVRLLALDALDERLDRHGFAALGRGGADTPERHQSLGATIAWSVDLLDDGVRHVYEVLGCFHGGATLDALEAVAAPADPLVLLDALDVLVDASLLPAPDLHGDIPRFRLLETIRHDAASRVDARPDADALHRRHSEHYARALERGGQVTVDDVPNLRLAVSRLLDAGDTEAAANLAINGRRVWFDAGALMEMRDLYARLADLELHPLIGARVAILAGSLGYVIGHLRDTEQLEAAIATLRDAGDFDPIAINAFCYLGAMALDRGDAEAADRFGSQAAEWAQGSYDSQGESMALDFRAYVARNRGDSERAAELMARAVEIARNHAAPADLSQRLASLSFALSAIGADAAAERAATEALELARAAAARPSERDALVALGEALRRDDPVAAIASLTRAVTMSFELGQEGIEELTRLARALAAAGDVERAALLAGAAAARRLAVAVDDPECAAILSDLEARFDAGVVALGAKLDQRAVVAVVAEAAAKVR